ncbi:MAG: ABC transporter ATP-binding protein [Anaerolineaceae bacterium]|nr:ABC transporter ATP-binding protein [Anaerolineaceae bacterium]
MAYLEMKQITKVFPGVVANDNINFSVEKGEIHALLGENGAGKTTLMNILYGLYRQTSGEIWINDKKVAITSPKEAIDLGIGMVHQHFMLIPALTIIENVVLGMKENKQILDLKRAASDVCAEAAKYDMTIDPFMETWKLSVGQQQRLEIIKALYRGVKLLILDEPTAVLTPQEVSVFFTMVRKLSEEGHTVIFITHKLPEVMQLCGRCTVLRHGKLETTVNINDVKNKQELARLMVGKDVEFSVQKTPAVPGEEVLSIKNLNARNNKGLPALKNVSFDVHAGEILGVAGVDGNGQSELVECLTGLRKIDSGVIRIMGVEIPKLAARTILEQGVSHIPEDRHRRGMLKDMSVKENLILMNYFKEPYSTKGFLNWKWISGYAQELCKEFNVKTPSIEEKADKLSGGNQQKFIVGRELERKPKLLIAMHPDRGLDIGATKYIQSRIVAARDSGSAVLLVSTELDEIMELSDRIIVMYEGGIIGLIDDPQVTREYIGLLMAGTRPQDSLEWMSPCP